MTDKISDSVNDVRDHVLELIDFLSAYDARRNLPVRSVSDFRMFMLRESDLPVHPAVQLLRAEEGPWLTVDFIDPPDAPSVPEHIKPLLRAGLPLSASKEPSVIAAWPADDEKPTATENADEAGPSEMSPEETLRRSDLLAEAAAWIQTQWLSWSKQTHLASAVKSLHRNLFEQREQLLLDRESTELLWGFGRGRWMKDGFTIDHPLLTFPVEIDLDSQNQRITVRASGSHQIESNYLLGLDLHDRSSLSAARTASVEFTLDPWTGTECTQLITRVARSIDDNAVVVESATAAGPDFRADTSWTLFMRRRMPDSQGFLEKMREAYLDPEGLIPAPLQDIVARASGAPVPRGSVGEVASGHSAVSADPLLLPLATNEQQQRILSLAQTHPGVTVQGPPGTGKSHTIANLISHYVAYGQRVLVVAEKEQALRVLAEKVPEDIRDLTVSVLGADEESRKQLEQSISNIQARVSVLDKRESDEQIQRLRTELDRLDRGIAETTSDMLKAREIETVELEGNWVAGTNPTPQQAGQWLQQSAERFGYIEDQISPSTPSPITPAELHEFVALLKSPGIQKALEALQILPEPADLLAGAELKELSEHIRRGYASASTVKPAFRSWDIFEAADPSLISVLASDLETASSNLAEIENSAYSSVLKHASDPLRSQEWAMYLARLIELRENAYTLRRILLAHTVELPERLEPDLSQRLQEAHDALVAKGKLGMFDRQSKKTLEVFSVDSRVPATAGDVAVCIAAVTLEDVRSQIAALWSNQSPAYGSQELSQRPEDDVAAEIAMFQRLVGHPDLTSDLNSRLTLIGYGRVPKAGSDALSLAASHLKSGKGWHDVSQAEAKVDSIRSALTSGANTIGASPLFQNLLQDLSSEEFGEWDAHRGMVLSLLEKRTSARRLLHLRSTLSAASPKWTERIIADASSAQDPQNLGIAWEFRQLESWLRALTNKANPGQLQAEIDEFASRRRKTVSALVSEMAWRRLADNLGPKERQALQSYIQATKKYGKTGGKFAHRWISEMRRSLDESSSAVPAWIMTTSRALTSFKPGKVPPFDVLIIDEASQIGFEALPLLSLAKTAIVVGDDKQTSPENVGLNREQVFEIMDDYLSQVPNYRILFDPDNSLYDIAIQKFATPVMLTEHFRCLPEIISFSNQHAYSGLMTPLRDQPPVPGWSALGLVKVRDGYRQGDVNEPEAEQVAELVKELCGKPDYQGMTFGVVSLLGSSQSKLIWDLLYDRLGPEEMERRRIRCGEAANFQGDERDVMVISTVVAVDPSLPNKRFGSMTSLRDLRRINVATSRAKNQMWLVTSVEPNQLPNGDLRAELIRHCASAGTASNSATEENLFDACDSEFEIRVVRDILNRGYKGVQVQHKVGKYRLDIVVSGPDARLAIECDGDRWHGPDVWHRDRARQEVLERAGWTFARIRGSAYFRDPATAMQPVWERLASLGIPTGDEWLTRPREAVIREVSRKRAEAQASGTSETDDTPDSTNWKIESTALEGSRPTPNGVEPKPPTPSLPAIAVLRQYDPELPPGAGIGPETKEPIAARAESIPSEDSLKRLHSLATGNDLDVGADELGDDREPEAGEPLEGSLRSQGSVTLAPYISWIPEELAPVASTNLSSVQQGLISIIRAEGPMIARQAYLRYVQASGGQRVGREAQRLFNQAVSRALQAGSLARITDGMPGIVQATVYLPGHPQVRLRALGPRRIFDVPASELHRLMEMLTDEGVSNDELPREVLNCYGLRKLTQKTQAYIQDCQDYVS